MSDPKPPLITRKDAALYFANRVLIAYVLLQAGLFAVAMLSAPHENSREWRPPAVAFFAALKVWMCGIPLIWLSTLSISESLWRSTFEPQKIVYPFYFQWRTVFLLVCVISCASSVTLVGFSSLIRVSVILGALALGWDMFARQLRDFIERRIVPPLWPALLLGSLLLLWHVLFLTLDSNPPGRSFSDKVFFQCALSLLHIEAVSTLLVLNVTARWRTEGRFPLEGNHRFQISLGTLLGLTLSIAGWIAFSMWLLNR